MSALQLQTSPGQLARIEKRAVGVFLRRENSVIEIKNDLALFVNECLAAASPHLKSDEGSAAIQAVEYSNIGAFIDVKEIGRASCRERV